MKENEITLSNLVDDLKVRFEKMKTIFFSLNEKNNLIDIYVQRTYNAKIAPSTAQIDYFITLKNTDYISKCNLKKVNKYAMSAAITLAKEYPDVKFYLSA